MAEWRSVRNLPYFYRTFAPLLRSGVLASDALRGTANLLPTAGMAAGLVEAGMPVSAALAATGALPAEHLRFIEVGERCGGLDRILDDLAEAAERQLAAEQRIRSGMFLPALQLHAAAFVLPLPVLLLGGDAMGYGSSVLGFVAIFWGGALALRLGWRRLTLTQKDALMVKIPVMREVWEHYELWRMLSALALCLKTSMGFPDALRMAGETCLRARRRQALEQAAAAVEQRGGKVSAELAASGQFPKELIVFWTNGEATGRLDDVFARLAARHFEEFQQGIHRVATWLPRCAYAIVALLLIVQILRAGAAYASRLNP